MRQAWLLAALLLVPAAPVAAQDPAAAHLSPAAAVLYAHHHDSDTEELHGWMNTHVVDPTGNDVALGPTDPGCCPQGRTHTFTLSPALTGDVELDPSGNIVLDAYIGAGGSQGVVRVSTELKHGDEVVASGAAVNHVYQQAGTGAYGKVSWTVAPDVTTLAVGKELVWSITLTGVAVQTVFISVSPERGSTSITLPVLSTTAAPGSGAAGATVSHVLTGQSATVTQSPAQPTTARHVYNWTSSLTAPFLTLAVERGNGNATVTIHDGTQQRYNRSFSASGNETKPLAGAQKGNWTIVVDLAGFAGTVSLTIAEGGTTGTATGTSSRTSTSRSGTGTTPANSTTPTTSGDGDGKDTPGPAPALLFALLAVALLVRRRLA